jgi:hypothetical protein
MLHIHSACGLPFFIILSLLLHSFSQQLIIILLPGTRDDNVAANLLSFTNLIFMYHLSCDVANYGSGSKTVNMSPPYPPPLQTIKAVED